MIIYDEYALNIAELLLDRSYMMSNQMHYLLYLDLYIGWMYILDVGM